MIILAMKTPNIKRQVQTVLRNENPYPTQTELDAWRDPDTWVVFWKHTNFAVKESLSTIGIFQSS